MNNINKIKELCYIIKCDLYRYKTDASFKSFLKAYLIPGFRYIFWLRICQYYKTNNSIMLGITSLILRHYSIRYGIMIPYQTTIGKGFYIGHFSCIVVNRNSVIGDNVNISQGVTIGQKNGGKNPGAPIIGNMVYLGAGAKVIGHCTIGERAVVGANAVVTQDVSSFAVVAGNPAIELSKKASFAYVGSFYPKF